jgi:hypothetical protein
MLNAVFLSPTLLNAWFWSCHDNQDLFFVPPYAQNITRIIEGGPLT